MCNTVLWLVHSNKTQPNVLSMNSWTQALSHPPPSPHVSDVCVFGSESGLPACSHMLFYPSVASGTLGRPPSLPPSLPPPPASSSLFWLTISLSLLLLLSPLFPSHLFLSGCPPPTVCLSHILSLLRGFLGLCLSRGDGLVSVSFLLFPAVSSLPLLAEKEMKRRSISKGTEVAWN